MHNLTTQQFKATKSNETIPIKNKNFFPSSTKKTEKINSQTNYEIIINKKN